MLNNAKPNYIKQELGWLTVVLKHYNDVSNKSTGHEIFECKFQIAWMGNDVPRKFWYHFDNMSEEIINSEFHL
jgi:uncharacterized protein YcnI